MVSNEVGFISDEVGFAAAMRLAQGESRSIYPLVLLKLGAGKDTKRLS